MVFKEINMYLSIKFIHIISSTLLFGTGLGSAFFMFMAYRTNNMLVMAKTNRIVVIADFIFTTPTVVIQLVTGLYLLDQLGKSWTSSWGLLVLGLYFFVGLCWLPVVWLQLNLAKQAEQLERPDKRYHQYMKIWCILGGMAFPAVIVLYALMIFKPFWSI